MLNLISKHKHKHLEAAIGNRHRKRATESPKKAVATAELPESAAAYTELLVRRLSVEWPRGERGRHRDGSKSVANQRPTKMLFIINFDPIHTRVRDIEKHFEPYGNVMHVRIRRNFAFVQFETQEEATKALECIHMSKILDRVVSVEYALRDDGERGSRSINPRRDYGRHGDSPYRSRSPYRRDRPSPDYGCARSPVYDKYRGPSYDRFMSPAYEPYRRDNLLVSSIKRLAELVKTGKEALMYCNMDELGDIMMETWRLHQELDPHCSNEFVEKL
nr:nucleotide-binding, alpha-beta plait [Tanacetum cinerariifolium]